MAKSDAVWGIDIGNSSLKALRLRPGSGANDVEALAFDFIEYPKVLTQPGAEPEKLVAEAMKQFLSRNSVLGDKVAISVSGQNGLARFIKLPPVEAKKIPDIVRFEAKQQIPFDLQDVVWDYQQMGASDASDGFAMETEIGLFAMKREQVNRSLEPFQQAGVEVDFVQLTPLCLYNYIAFDRLTDLPAAQDYDPEDPPESIVVLSMGTDATDLVVTNGFRVWQRSIPIGGNHFTRALTKELKLTFAKAEHLKRNATAAQDPKAIFQAMRPVFSDLLTEIQRSIGYFTTIDRNAKIGRMVALGNGMKLPGLRRYLKQNLGFEVERVDSYRGLTGPEVVAAPAFKENLLCFGVSYGLGLQALDEGVLKTNLLPREIVRDRIIRQKKPWAVAAAAIVLLSCTVSFFSAAMALSTVTSGEWKSAEEAASSVTKKAEGYTAAHSTAEAALADVDEIGQGVTKNVEGRLLWLEFLAALNACLPIDKPDDPAMEIPLETRISRRNTLFLENVHCQKSDELSAWFDAVVKARYYEPPEDGSLPQADAEAETAEPEIEGPSGPGWVVQLTGYHYRNFRTFQEARDAGGSQGAQHVRDTLMDNLRWMQVSWPNSETGEMETVSMEDLGIAFPVLIEPLAPYDVMVQRASAPQRSGMSGMGGMGGMDGMGGYEGGSMYGGAGGFSGGGAGISRPTARADQEAGEDGEEPEEDLDAPIPLRRFDFAIMFVWVPTTPSERAEKRLAEQEALAAEQAAEGFPEEPGMELDMEPGMGTDPTLGAPPVSVPGAASGPGMPPVVAAGAGAGPAGGTPLGATPAPGTGPDPATPPVSVPGTAPGQGTPPGP